MERARQFTYTHQHPSSRVTNQGRREGQHVELRGRHNTPCTWTEGAPAIFANTRTQTWDPALWYHVKLHALANATKNPNWWKGQGNSLIHISSVVCEEWGGLWEEGICGTRGRASLQRKKRPSRKPARRKWAEVMHMWKVGDGEAAHGWKGWCISRG
jgi:hypothetical protein